MVDGASVSCVATIVSSVSWSAVPSYIPVFGSGCRCSKLSKLAGEYRWSLSNFQVFGVPTCEGTVKWGPNLFKRVFVCVLPFGAVSARCTTERFTFR